MSRGRVVDRPGDLLVARDALDRLGLLEPVVEALARPDVVVLEVDHRHPGVRPAHAVLGPVVLEEIELDHPVELAAERHRILGEPVQHVLPPHEDVLRHGVELPVPVVAVGQLQELPLEVDGRRGPPVAEAERRPAGQVARDLAEGLDRIVEREVPVDEVVLDHGEDDRRGPDLEVVRHLRHVGVAHDHVEAPVLLGIGVRLVPGVDDGAGVHRLQADLGLEEVGPLGDLVLGVLEVVLRPDLARAGEDLARDQERHHVLDDPREGAAAVHEVVLVGAVAVALGVGVVLVDEDALLGRGGRLRAPAREVEDPLARPVPDHEVPRVRALRGRVLGVGVVDVEAGPVREDQVDEARLLLGRELLLLGVLEPPGVPQRALGLVVPADARGPVGLVGVDEEEGGQDRVEVRLVADGDPVLGLDPHHLRDGHAVLAPVRVTRADRRPPAPRWGPRPTEKG